MSHTTIHMHDCKNVRVDHTFRANGNSIAIEIETENGCTRLTLFGLPESVTDKIFYALADSKTEDYDDLAKERAA